MPAAEAQRREPNLPPRPLVWRPGSIVHLAVLLSGFAAGLWPEAIYTTEPRIGAPLPALQTVALAVAVCLLLVLPLQAIGWDLGRRPARALLAAAAEAAVVVGLALPLLGGGAVVADATPVDMARVVLMLAALVPAALAAAVWMQRPAARPGVLVASLTATAGLPAGWYIAADFLLAWDGDWLWHAGPLTRLWSVGASRQPLAVGPLWAWLLWPLVGAALLAGAWALRRGRPVQTPGAASAGATTEPPGPASRP